VSSITKSFRLRTLAVVATLAVAACTGPSATGPAATSPGGTTGPAPTTGAPTAATGEVPAPDLTSIAVGVSVNEMSQYAAVLAEQLELYDKYGLDVEPVTVFEGDGRAVAALQAEQVQVAFTGTSSALSSQLTDAQYVDIAVNALLLTDNLTCQAGIDTADEVRGKSIAISTFGGTSNAAALLALQALELTPADAVITPTGGQDVRLAALTGGSVDCAIVDSNLEADMIAQGFAIAARLKEARIEYGRSGMGVLESWLAEHRATAVAATAAVLEAQHVIFTDEDTTVENYMAFRQIDDPTARKQVQDFVAVGNHNLMWTDNAFNNARKTLAMINPDIVDVAVGDAFDRSILQELVDLGLYEKLGIEPSGS
jgi:ABC-type nitrate/sulfonate/bicarbonate transport system substrate-binding protein